MPGLYVNDPGATSSLGNILGGLAENLSPQGQARAQLLYQQTEQADWANRKASTEVPAYEQGVVSAGQLPALYGADPGSVAGTVAAAAQPPDAPYGGPGASARGVGVVSGGSPMQGWFRGLQAAGQLSPEAARTGITMGQGRVVGPGMTDQSIATRSTAPMSPGTRVDVSGTGQGPFITGGDVYGAKAAETGGAADPAAAKVDVQQGAQAEANLGKLSLVRGLYKQFVDPQANPTGILTEEGTRKLSQALGIRVDRLTPLADVKAEIRRTFASMVANLRDNQGLPMFKGGLPQILEQFPDPDAEPARFESAVHALELSLGQQKADGDAALEYLRNGPSAAGYVQVLQAKGRNAAQVREAFDQAGIKVETGAPAATTSPAPPAPLPPGTVLKAPDPGDVAQAKSILAQAIKTDPNNGPKVRQQLIDHARAKGVDLELGGF